MKANRNKSVIKTNIPNLFTEQGWNFYILSRKKMYHAYQIFELQLEL